MGHEDQGTIPAQICGKREHSQKNKFNKLQQVNVKIFAFIIGRHESIV